MYPILFNAGPLTVHTYGFMIAVGFIVTLVWVSNEAKQDGIDSEKIVDLCFYAIISGLIGGRLFYVIIEWNDYKNNISEIFKIWNGGLVFFGGFLVALPICFWHMKRHSMPILKTLDILAPALAIGHAFGRIGCFAAGCCYGKACTLPWAVTFTDKHTLALPNIPLHPTQLYEAIMNLAIFTFLVILRKYRPKQGSILVSYLILYGIGRSIIEIFRGDERGSFLFDTFSPAQVIGIVMLIFGITLGVLLFKDNMNITKQHTKNKKVRHNKKTPR